MNHRILVVALFMVFLLISGCGPSKHETNLEQYRLQVEALKSQAETQAKYQAQQEEARQEALQAQAEAATAQEQMRQETLRLAMQHAASGNGSDNTIAIVVIICLSIIVLLVIWWHFRLTMTTVNQRRPRTSSFLLPGDARFEMELLRWAEWHNTSVGKDYDGYYTYSNGVKTRIRAFLPRQLSSWS